MIFFLSPPIPFQTDQTLRRDMWLKKFTILSKAWLSYIANYVYFKKKKLIFHFTFIINFENSIYAENQYGYLCCLKVIFCLKFVLISFFKREIPRSLGKERIRWLRT